MTRDFLDIKLVNQTQSPMLYAHVTGRHESNNAMFLLEADGRTVRDLTSNGQELAPLGFSHAIPIGGPGAKKMVRVPRLAGGRIYFSKGRPLTFRVNPGPALVEPSAMNETDPNYEGAWIFCELTFNSSELYVNISNVDFVSIPVALKLENDAGHFKHVSGLPAGGALKIAQRLEKLGGPWKKLVIRGSNGDLIRVLSPNSALDAIPGLFKGHYSNYVDAVWKKYEHTDLWVDTQRSGWGVFKGRVRNGKLHFTGKYEFDFQKPSTKDIFSCDTGPFAVRVSPPNDYEQARLNVGARIAAAFNRTTLLVNNQQPHKERVASFYREKPVNYFARICHEVSIAGRGYAFPYDDVLPVGAIDQSGSISDPNPKILKVTVGGVERADL
ncbi:hypothetical protein B0T10DRAFT_485568 [Thelonectria olida]|uniref:GH64 domain-containing protein n=1 Tax=Thelonectria olida TaxID=1576542 RepID=A0A9P8W495_9HYPO|nr:hypothetical protein B0T10DRAFT_485568 [Thelonectria olida]